MELKRMKAAIVGCGVISEVYMNFFRDRGRMIELVACADLDEARMHRSAEAYGLRAMPFEEILADPEIEIIINLTNPAAHYPLTKKALLSGKHVFTEKTIAVTVEEGIELCEISREKGVRLGSAPDTFLGGGLQTARYAIESGLIGKPLSFVASVSRDNGIFGEMLPHLCRPGGGVIFDIGCYYLTALASMFGPVEKISAFAGINEPERTNMRMTSPNFGKPYTVEVENVIAAVLQFQNGVRGTFHMNSDSILDEEARLKIYGTEGILSAGDPNLFGSPVTVKKMLGEEIRFPFTHGYTVQSRGIGATEMAWAIRSGRPHRASMELACHVLEVAHGIEESARSGEVYRTRTAFAVPAALPAGYLDNGMWGPTEESALI